MRAVLFKAEQKTYPISYRETREETDGKKVVFSVQGPRDGADSTFAAGDTVVVNVHGGVSRGREAGGEDDALQGRPLGHAQTVLGEQAPQVHARRHLAQGPLDHQAGLHAGRAFALLELSITGGLVLDADFGGGHTAKAEGRFENKIIGVVLSDSRADGKLRKFQVDWDAWGMSSSRSPWSRACSFRKSTTCRPRISSLPATMLIQIRYLDFKSLRG